jgi:hypothetical protein
MAGSGASGGPSHRTRPCGEKDGPPFGLSGRFSLRSWGTPEILLAPGGQFSLALALTLAGNARSGAIQLAAISIAGPYVDQTGSRIR